MRTALGRSPRRSDDEHPVDDSAPVSKRKRLKTAPVRSHKCDRCGRPLKDGRWVYSRFTGSRYCYPGGGCNK